MRNTHFFMAALLVTLVCRGKTFAENTNALQEMINKAAPGGEVIIPKGVFKEPITITKPIKLRGESRDECVVEVEADQPAIRFASKKEASVENLTVRWKRATSAPSQEPQAAIVASDSKLQLRNVRVIASDNDARCPSGFTAIGFCDVKVEACEFEGFDFTIQFANGAKGTLAECTVSKPGHCGITAGPNSTVNVERTLVTGSAYHGLRCTGGELNAKHNLIVANKNRGIYLGNKSAKGTIEENVILDNGTGISGFAESEVKIHHNFIAGSDYAAIDMRDSCRFKVEQNLLANNSRGLVLFAETGKNRNVVGPNASTANKTETEGFTPAPDFQKVDGELAEGQFSTEKASGFGVTDPAPLKPLWERWTALRKTAAAN